MSESFSPEVLGPKLTALAGTRRPRFVCAVSGGGDSLSLAHALIALKTDLRLVHVNHHLHPDSDDWAERVLAFARAHDVPARSLDAIVQSGGNVEANARAARYGVLAADLEDNEVLLTAHHQDDQALTLLLQLLRGAGPAGLAAMPERGICGQAEHWRPVLDTPAKALRDYAASQNLPVVHDPSNDQTRFDRNYLRAHVVPALEARWPAFARTLARSAAHCAQADALLGELAMLDAPTLVERRGLDLSVASIPDERRAENALRWFLREQRIALPATVRLREFVRQVRVAAADTAPSLALGAQTLRSYERHVFLTTASGDLHSVELTLVPEQPLALPNQVGTLIWHAPAHSAALCVRFRQGGERYGHGPSRRLKHFFQTQRVLPWCRDQVPLICDGARIVAIGDWWQDADLSGNITWSPDMRFTL